MSSFVSDVIFSLVQCKKTKSPKGLCTIPWDRLIYYYDRHQVGTFCVLNPKTRKINLIHDVTFLNKSYGEFNKVDDTVIVPMSYEGLNDEDVDDSIFINNRSNNNDYNVVSDDTESESKEEGFF